MLVCRPTLRLSSARPIPSLDRAIVSRIEKARTIDWIPPSATGFVLAVASCRLPALVLGGASLREGRDWAKGSRRYRLKTTSLSSHMSRRA